MKTKIIIILFVITLLTPGNSDCQTPSNKSDTLKLLLNSSRTKNRDLFLLFGWQGCGWCRMFDRYHADPQVKEILNKYFLISKIDIYKSKASEELYVRYGKDGTPSWTIFNLKGEIVADSDNGNGNVGYPSKEDELDHYIFAVKKAAPGISDSETNLLIAKLKEHKSLKE
jgi:hypothetical protein